jgi:alanine racemase
VASVFSHLSASEDPAHDEFTAQQIQKFQLAATGIESGLGYPVLKHILNSGGILRFPHAGMDMVRLGIGLYGVDPRPNGGAQLRPVTSFYSSISQLRLVKAGDSVGYSRKAIGHSDRMVATLPVGYADGLRRSLGNEKGFVIINGQKAPLLGSICMDMCMADVTGIACNEGDEAELFGANISIAEWARMCETIPYEILTGISPRVPRVYVGEG